MRGTARGSFAVFVPTVHTIGRFTHGSADAWAVIEKKAGLQLQLTPYPASPARKAKGRSRRDAIARDYARQIKSR